MDGAALLEPGGEGGGRTEVKASLVCGENSVNRMEMLGVARLTGIPKGPCGNMDRDRTRVWREQG